jgi:hypothetical protein
MLLKKLDRKAAKGTRAVARADDGDAASRPQGT